ncbi:carboxymuconolactone decarboxylase, partial [Mycobacterium marinum]
TSARRACSPSPAAPSRASTRSGRQGAAQ